MCYVEELFVQIEDECVFVLVLRIPEPLAFYLLFKEQGTPLKKSLNTDIMRLLRGIAANGENYKHIYSKYFVFEVSAYESKWKARIPQIQVGQTSYSLMDKDFAVSAKLRDDVFKDDLLLGVDSDSVKYVESPEVATILEAATKRVDRSCCQVETAISAPSKEPTQRSQGAHASNNSIHNSEVDVGQEFVIHRRKSQLDESDNKMIKSPSKGTQSLPVNTSPNAASSRKPHSSALTRSGNECDVGPEFVRTRNRTLPSDSRIKSPSKATQSTVIEDNSRLGKVSSPRNNSSSAVTPLVNGTKNDNDRQERGLHSRKRPLAKESIPSLLNRPNTSGPVMRSRIRPKSRSSRGGSTPSTPVSNVCVPSESRSSRSVASPVKKKSKNMNSPMQVNDGDSTSISSDDDVVRITDAETGVVKSTINTSPQGKSTVEGIKAFLSSFWPRK